MKEINKTIEFDFLSFYETKQKLLKKGYKRVAVYYDKEVYKRVFYGIPETINLMTKSKTF